MHLLKKCLDLLVFPCATLIFSHLCSSIKNRSFLNESQLLLQNQNLKNQNSVSTFPILVSCWIVLSVKILCENGSCLTDGVFTWNKFPVILTRHSQIDLNIPRISFKKTKILLFSVEKIPLYHFFPYSIYKIGNISRVTKKC